MNISIDDYKKWYHNLAVQYQMFSYIKKREYAMISRNDDRVAIRKLKITNVQGFQFWWTLLIEQQKDTRMFEHYYSLASYVNIPNRSFKRVEGKGVYDTDEEYWKTPYKDQVSYDMLIDIDSKTDDLFYAHLSAMKVHAMLDKWNVPHKIFCSGRGFHFIIPYEDFTIAENPIGRNEFNPHDDENIYKRYQSIAVYLHEHCSELIDSDIYDSRRVCRLPFSLNIDEYNKAFVCFPFIDEDMFLSFHEGMRDISYWLQHDIRSAKPKVFNSSGSVLKLLKFCHEMQ